MGSQRTQSEQKEAGTTPANNELPKERENARE